MSKLAWLRPGSYLSAGQNLDESGYHIDVAISGVGTNADWTTVFQGLTFQDTAPTPTGPAATVAFTVDDGIFQTNGNAVVNQLFPENGSELENFAPPPARIIVAKWLCCAEIRGRAPKP